MDRSAPATRPDRPPAHERRQLQLDPDPELPATEGLHVLFATAELRPLVSAGGLGEAASGLVAALRDAGVRGHRGVARLLRLGELDRCVRQPNSRCTGLGRSRPLLFGSVSIPMLDGLPSSRSRASSGPTLMWTRTDSGLVRQHRPLSHRIQCCNWLPRSEAGEYDIVHLNDWHTAFAPAFTPPQIPQMLTIHNLGHQGFTPIRALAAPAAIFAASPTRGAMASTRWQARFRVVDRVTTVSPNYAR